MLKQKYLSVCLLTALGSAAQAERPVTDPASQQAHQRVIQAQLKSQATEQQVQTRIRAHLNKVLEQQHQRGVVSANTLKQLPAPLTEDDFFQYDADHVKLGNLLFYDKILSGNQNISCASCHHGMAATGDGLSLPVGEGGNGLGVTRDSGFELDAVHERVPRNAPHVFNLGAKFHDVMFHDGRVAVDASQANGFLNPAGSNLLPGLDNALAVQAMFPVTSATEMAGQVGENAVADATAVGNLAGPGGVWEILAGRIQSVDEYVDLFKDVYPDVNQASDITFAHVANAIAAFEATAWRADNSPFDQYLRGDDGAMSPNQIDGMNLFYGEAGCSGCHTGKLLASNEFKSIAMPQIGPGKGDNLPGFHDGLDDFGHERVTGNEADRFKFRVLTVRNALLTGPWGHSGAYDRLRDMIMHHLNPAQALEDYDRSQARMPYRRDLAALDFAVMNDSYSRNAILASSDIQPVNLSETQIDRLMDFMDAVTDRKSMDIRIDVPVRVPSGLPVFD